MTVRSVALKAEVGTLFYYKVTMYILKHNIVQHDD